MSTKCRKPLRRTPLKRVSKKLGAKLRQYRVLAVQFKKDNPTCQVCCVKFTSDVHHKAGRGRNLLNVATWMPVCRPCHDLIHQHPSFARKQGYLSP